MERGDHLSSSEELSEEMVSVKIDRADVSAVTLELPFYSSSHANIAYNSLRIDKEPARGNVVKELSVRDNFLIVKISSRDIKRLRSSVTSFVDFAILVTNTLGRYGQPSE
ncbi:uncharacterized protein TNCT_191451 [Trichonephila clavata]|uniref:L antigen family member 3 n=1 Tax=Trichonephila clavata TaxID=2740835 RepID=A0A8X6GQB0_TRICU|nr:uncharacterized protein TNCT_191451 [Trichonephila clavata]